MAKPWDLSERSMLFAVDVFAFCRTVRRTEESRDVIRQLRRAATSVAANYRAAKRGRTTRDFASKMGIAIEEADEAEFWLDFAVRIGLATAPTVRALRIEANELTAIFTQSCKTARKRIPGQR
jgi:four helix bundle protein